MTGAFQSRRRAMAARLSVLDTSGSMIASYPSATFALGPKVVRGFAAARDHELRALPLERVAVDPFPASQIRVRVFAHHPRELHVSPAVPPRDLSQHERAAVPRDPAPSRALRHLALRVQDVDIRRPHRGIFDVASVAVRVHEREHAHLYKRMAGWS
eukprot:30851-Pelagococcus_subviridis.AAC.2